MASAGFETPTEAAKRFRDINVNTIISHVNGNRAISKKAAEKYAKLFGCTAGWILYGEGTAPGARPPETEAWLERIKHAATEAVISGVDSNDVVNALLDVINTIRQIAEHHPERLPIAKGVLERAAEQSRIRRISDKEDNGEQH
ncbi:hypothetical protein [Rhizobium sp. RCAM05973]|uniref:hypothetical protein n=1 Tax=Rhizobium sp. RCAM05973 TaxID=2994066 RepID=UPI0022EBB8F3|nr:hypothetical protein [Rhizobium sp. RCAM05973]